MSVTPPTVRAEELFLAACDLPAAERAAYLAHECGDDALRREVEALLANLDQAEDAGFLEAATRPGESPLLPARTRLGEYEIVRLLGEGGSGRVYEARHARLGRRVAVKVLSDAARRDPEALARFEREIAHIGGLSHPNVVAASDARRFGRHFFLVTELLDGVTLRELMRGRPTLPVADAAEVARQLAAGVQYLADHGLVHRDLSPANVMVTSAGRVAILDLGLATLVAGGGSQRLTNTGLFVGTVGYLSPEQSEDARAVDSRSDLYAVGCLLHALLVGHAPFRESPTVSVREWLNRLCAEAPPDVRTGRPDVPAPVAEVCARLLATKAADRFDVPADVADRLTPFAAGNTLAETVRAILAESLPPPEVLRSESPAHPRPWAAWRSWKPALVWGLAVAVIGLASVVLVPTSRPHPVSSPVLNDWEAAPLSVSLGREAYPALSRDGRTVAYAWGGVNGSNVDVYAVGPGDREPRRLTTHPANDVAPAWSPDGRRVAFWRHLGSGRSQLLTVPAAGGDEIAEWEADQPVKHLDWTPDGRHLAFGLGQSQRHPPGVYFLDVATKEVRRVVATPDGSNDLGPRVSPDGTEVAFVRRSGTYTEDQLVCVATIAVGSNPRTILQRKGFFGGVDWTADGRELVVSFGRSGRNRLWRLPASGGEPAELRVPLDSSLGMPAVARTGRRLAFVAVADEWTVWRQRLGKPGEAPPPAENLFATNRSDDAPAYSPDGQRIAYASDRSGHNEIWVYDLATRATRPVTQFRGPDVGSPQWHPDGNQIAFDSTYDGRSGLFVVACDRPGEARRVACEGVDSAVLPCWSADGRWLVFVAISGGTETVSRVAAAGGPAVRLALDRGTSPRVSLDGEWVYFLDAQTRLCRTPFARGEVEVVNGHRYAHSSVWALGREGVYALDPGGPPRGRLLFRGFADPQPRVLGDYRAEHVYLNGRYPGGRVAVSPTEDELLYVQYSREGSSVYVVDGFR